MFLCSGCCAVLWSSCQFLMTSRHVGVFALPRHHLLSSDVPSIELFQSLFSGCGTLLQNVTSARHHQLFSESVWRLFSFVIPSPNPCSAHACRSELIMISRPVARFLCSLVFKILILSGFLLFSCATSPVNFLTHANLSVVVWFDNFRHCNRSFYLLTCPLVVCRYIVDCL